MSKTSESKNPALINPEWPIPVYLTIDKGWKVSHADDGLTDKSALSHPDFPGVSIPHNKIAIDGDAAFDVLIAKIYEQAVTYGRTQQAAKILLKNQPEIEI